MGIPARLLANDCSDDRRIQVVLARARDELHFLEHWIRERVTALVYATGRVPLLPPCGYRLPSKPDRSDGLAAIQQRCARRQQLVRRRARVLLELRVLVALLGIH